jgi:hypothetical protein
VVVFSGIISCTGLSEADSERFRILGESLEKSGKAQVISTGLILESLKEKMSDPLTYEKARVWFPVAERIHISSTILRSEIKKLKSRKDFEKTDSDSLFTQFSRYRDTMLALDPAIKINFSDIFFPAGFFPSTADSFYSVNFSKTTNEIRVIMLNNIDYVLAVTENRLIRFCSEQWSGMRLICEFPSAIVGQNKSQLTEGQELEIIAGVGMFKQLAGLEVKVNDKEILVGEDGVFTYKRTVSKPGSYSIPVSVSFIDQDGKQQTISKNVDYKVVRTQ